MKLARKIAIIGSIYSIFVSLIAAQAAESVQLVNTGGGGIFPANVMTIEATLTKNKENPVLVFQQTKVSSFDDPDVKGRRITISNLLVNVDDKNSLDGKLDICFISRNIQSCGQVTLGGVMTSKNQKKVLQIKALSPQLETTPVSRAKDWKLYLEVR